MDFNIPLAGHTQTIYPVRVGFTCKNGDSYTYPYSQLSYSNIANKDKIEEIDGVFQTISNLNTDPAVQEQTWKTDTDIGYSDSQTGVPPYAHRGIFVFVVKSITSHPVLQCKSWINDAETITNEGHPKKCPGTFSQLTPPYVQAGTAGDYAFYFIPISSGSFEGRLCGYLNDGSADAGSLIPPGNHAQVTGANTYR